MLSEISRSVALLSFSHLWRISLGVVLPGGGNLMSGDQGVEGLCKEVIASMSVDYKLVMGGGESRTGGSPGTMRERRLGGLKDLVDEEANGVGVVSVSRREVMLISTLSRLGVQLPVMTMSITSARST